jgi:predicted ATPase
VAGNGVGDHRLITLTGAGGVGKTRPAQRAAAGAVGAVGGGGTAARAGGGGAYGPAAEDTAASRFPDGAWWADLSALDGQDLLLAAVSDAVGLADHSPRMPVEALCNGTRTRDCCSSSTPASR